MCWVRSCVGICSTPTASLPVARSAYNVAVRRARRGALVRELTLSRSFRSDAVVGVSLRSARTGLSHDHRTSRALRVGYADSLRPPLTPGARAIETPQADRRDTPTTPGIRAPLPCPQPYGCARGRPRTPPLAAEAGAPRESRCEPGG